MGNVVETDDYTITFDQSAGYLRVEISGSRASLDIARSYWRTIAETALETKNERLLVIEDIPEQITVSEVHMLITELSELPVRDIRLAFVDRYSQHKSLNEFGALVGENRGLNIRTFDSETDAADWLAEGYLVAS